MNISNHLPHLMAMNLRKRFSCSLISKPFLILCGNSGSGKSKVATEFAAWIDSESSSGSPCKAFVAVGADWTDNRHVLGFANTLRMEEHVVDGANVSAPVYQATEILKLILKANGAPDLPHFLILDEMNLSHVERYFSDFLAHLESPDEPMRLHHLETCFIHRYDGKDEGDRWELLPQKIHLPQNLFVIGTVNVDETTYMFSPKVLDRANVIECRTTHAQLQRAAEKLFEPKENGHPEKAPEGTAEAFMALALKARNNKWDENDPNPKTDSKTEWENFVDALHTISKEILEPAGMELTFRPQKEILAYGRVDYYFHCDGMGATAPSETFAAQPVEQDSATDAEAPESGGDSEVPSGAGSTPATAASGKWDWKRCLDEQIMQKILPKLVGNERKLRDVLGKLKEFCEENLLTEADKARVAEKREREPGDRNLSYAKILQMQRRLETDRFTGYF